MKTEKRSRPESLEMTKSLRLSRCRNAQAAFSLLELTVILGTLSCLLAVLAVGFAGSDSHSKTFQCMNNLRQLSCAWNMYTEDNRGFLVYNPTLASGSTPAWVSGWLDYSASPDNTNTDLLINHAKYPNSAFFGPYFKSADVFKCPADKSVVSIRGQQFPRVRSVSMNNFIGTSASSFTGNTKYRIYSRVEQIKSPAKLFLILDEREDSINEGCFLTDADTRFRVLDFPANYHDGAGNLAFVDGHSEVHKWQDSRTTPPLIPGTFVHTVDAAGDVDADWLDQHASEQK